MWALAGRTRRPPGAGKITVRTGPNRPRHSVVQGHGVGVCTVCGRTGRCRAAPGDAGADAEHPTGWCKGGPRGAMGAHPSHTLQVAWCFRPLQEGVPKTFCRRCGCYSESRLSKIGAACRGPTEARARHLRLLTSGKHPVDKAAVLVGVRPWRTSRRGGARSLACRCGREYPGHIPKGQCRGVGACSVSSRRRRRRRVRI